MIVITRSIGTNTVTLESFASGIRKAAELPVPVRAPAARLAASAGVGGCRRLKVSLSRPGAGRVEPGPGQPASERFRPPPAVARVVVVFVDEGGGV